MQKKYKVLITGSSGMLGIDLCRELADDYDVCGTDLVHSPQSTVHSFSKCDITNKRSISDAVKKAKPDVVIHTAAYTDVDGCELGKKKAYKINAEGTKNITLACKKVGATLIFISTDFVFNGRKKIPYKETDKTAPLSIYGDSKLKGETLVKKLLKNFFILRTSWLYGRHGKNFVDTIISKAKTEKILRVVNDQVGSPTYTKDLAKAIHILLDKVLKKERKNTRAQGHKGTRTQGHKVDGYGIYHVSNSGSVSWYGYAKEILSLAASRTKVSPISSKELARPAARPAMSVMDNSKFYKFTGFKMRPWNVALKEYLT